MRGRRLHEERGIRQSMPPFWPFKKKQEVNVLDEEPPATLVYKRGEDPNARADHTADQAAYKDALALFGDGSQTVQAASDQSVHYDGVTGESNPPQREDDAAPIVSKPEVAPAPETPHEPAFTWVHHTDGYHYKQLANGSFEPTAHTLGEDGVYRPYA